MATDRLDLIFIHEQLSKTLRKLFAEQQRLVSTRVYARGTKADKARRTGRLLEEVQGLRSKVNWSNEGNSARFDYPVYIRFLDMKRNGNRKIYNRPVWGHIYGAVNAMRYEFRDWMADYLSNTLRESFGLPSEK